MADDLAGANVNRTYTLAAINTAIFSFMLFFLFPRFERGEVNSLFFQLILVAMGVATFSLVTAAFLYYQASLSRGGREAERARISRRADQFWLVGYTVMFLAPSLVLFLIGLSAVASIWFGFWLVYFVFVMRTFAKVQTPRAPGGER